MKFSFVLTLYIFFISCSSFESTDQKKVQVNSIEDFDLYVPSEMSVHMRDMIKLNEEIKLKILAGDTLSEFPENFLKIYSAKLSETKNRSETFEAYSQAFIENEKEIFNINSTVPIKKRYNNAINTCIMCHKTECTGPIPVIEKLLIQ